ncbi:hypothetical protein V494_03447, partial [Pseudogymnoascus sp. VKM F-4513 (FW-928)]
NPQPPRPRPRLRPLQLADARAATRAFASPLAQLALRQLPETDRPGAG